MTETSRPMLRLYNTLTRAKEPFTPIDPANVRLYACGPTVYDFAHIGNARPVIVFDVLFRLLRHLYGADHVTYVRNVTDVDDKINARACAEHPDLPLNEAIARVTETTGRQFAEDVAALGCLPPTVEPRATGHIVEMRDLIERLVASGHAYVAEGHVLFDVPAFPEYGELSRRPLDEMEAGARIDVAPYKRSPLDFVLWKPSCENEPGWPSPAGIPGLGRPGWHIECSAMAWRHLGERFDIHAGGIDLVFPHHENEIAQSRCSFGSPAMANVWMHNGFLQVEGEKMSKSLGNFVTIRDVLKDWPGDVARLQMLSTHYRQPTDWTQDKLHLANDELLRWASFIAESVVTSYDVAPDIHVVSALSDDINTAEALAAVRALYKFASQKRRSADVDKFAATLVFLGFRHIDKPGFFERGFVGVDLPDGKSQSVYPLALRYSTAAANDDLETVSRITHDMAATGVDVRFDSAHGRLTLEGGTGASTGVGTLDNLIAARAAARAAKNWAESDRIRDELKAMGVQVKDNKDGTTTWEPLR